MFYKTKTLTQLKRTLKNLRKKCLFDDKKIYQTKIRILKQDILNLNLKIN
jgi:hypothetical protein